MSNSTIFIRRLIFSLFLSIRKSKKSQKSLYTVKNKKLYFAFNSRTKISTVLSFQTLTLTSTIFKTIGWKIKLLVKNKQQKIQFSLSCWEANVGIVLKF